jgi:hypothetical protein
VASSFKQSSLEFSVVSVPANPDALIVSMNDSSGKSVTAERAKREREIDLARLRHAPARKLTKAEQRAIEIAEIKRRGR